MVPPPATCRVRRQLTCMLGVSVLLSLLAGSCLSEISDISTDSETFVCTTDEHCARSSSPCCGFVGECIAGACVTTPQRADCCDHPRGCDHGCGVVGPECQVDSNCPGYVDDCCSPSAVCADGMCQPAERQNECCEEGKSCTETCEVTVRLSPCFSDEMCALPTPFCNDGECVQCLLDEHCAAELYCSEARCVATPQSHPPRHLWAHCPFFHLEPNASYLTFAIPLAGPVLSTDGRATHFDGILH